MGNVIAIQNLNGAAGRRWATISFKGTDELDAALKQAAADLNFRSKSDLLHDVLTRFVAQHNRQNIPFSRLKRAERTRQLAAELAEEVGYGRVVISLLATTSILAIKVALVGGVTN